MPLCQQRYRLTTIQEVLSSKKTFLRTITWRNFVIKSTKGLLRIILTAKTQVNAKKASLHFRIRRFKNEESLSRQQKIKLSLLLISYKC